MPHHGRILSAELDKKIVSGELIEATKGFGNPEHLTSFMDGSYGFGSFRARGVGHYFAMEALDESATKRMGLTLDLADAPTYQATNYAGGGDSILRVGIPTDMKVATRNELISEVQGLRSGKNTRLSMLRSMLDHNANTYTGPGSKDAKLALTVFDNIFNEKAGHESLTAITAMLLGYDASSYADEGDNAIRVFNKTKLLATDPMSVNQFLEANPLTRPESRIRGATLSGTFADSYSKRFEMIKERVLKGSESVASSGVVGRLRGRILGSAPKSSAKMMTEAPKPIARSVGKSSAGRSFFDDAVTSASGAKVIKAAGKAIKSVF